MAHSFATTLLLKRKTILLDSLRKKIYLHAVSFSIRFGYNLTWSVVTFVGINWVNHFLKHLKWVSSKSANGNVNNKLKLFSGNSWILPPRWKEAQRRQCNNASLTQKKKYTSFCVYQRARLKQKTIIRLPRMNPNDPLQFVYRLTLV